MATRDEYVEMTKSIYVTITTKVVLGAILSLIPISWNPIVGKILSTLLEPAIRWVQQKTADNADMLAFFKFTDFRVGVQSQEFQEAAFANWKVQQNGTKEEKKLAEEALWKSFKAFAVLTN